MLFITYSNAYSIKNGFYKAANCKGRFCFVRNDTIWFNYTMPVGEGYIRFAKGIIQGNGSIQLLTIKDKPKTLYDTIYIKQVENVNQLMLNVYDFRTLKEITKPIFYFIHEDYSYNYDKRIFLRKPFNFADSSYTLDYSALELPEAVLSFEEFKDDYNISNRIETVYLEIRKNEQAKYKITLAPRIAISEHFSEIKFKYDENENKMSLFFTEEIDGFQDRVIEFLPIEQPDMDDILEHVYMYYIK